MCTCVLERGKALAISALALPGTLVPSPIAVDQHGCADEKVNNCGQQLRLAPLGSAPRGSPRLESRLGSAWLGSAWPGFAQPSGPRGRLKKKIE